jgi:hypothetical protein
MIAAIIIIIRNCILERYCYSCFYWQIGAYNITHDLANFEEKYDIIFIVYIKLPQKRIYKRGKKEI